MKKKEINLSGFVLVLVMLFLSTPIFNDLSAQKAPRYKKAAYADESIELSNKYLQVYFHKRVAGWGWGEIYNSDGKLMAVLEHLGEIMLRDQDIPVRFAAGQFERSNTDAGEMLTFQVESVVVRDKLKTTSFNDWMRYPFTEPAITGEVSITLAKDKPLLYLKYRLEATGNYYARYIRGPWLRVGEASFGIEKDDAILPGVDWVLGDEWSSGTDFFKDPWALRVAPHPNKVAIPVMAISHQGDGIGMSWNPKQVATRWFNYRAHVPQPVFAAPNFIDRLNNNIMGLMVPDASVEGHENEIYAEIPLELKIGQRINFDAEVWLTKGRSLDVVTEWVQRNGLPEPSEPRWSHEETLNLIANAYNTNLWHEGEGFGIKQRPEDKLWANVPGFMNRYIQENEGTKLAAELKEKVEWSLAQSADRRKRNEEKDGHIKRGDELISIQREDGAFFFEPEGRHYRKDDFIVATSYIEPMGHEGDTALDVIMLPATELLDIARETGKKKYADAAKKSFEFCMHMTRPEAGDFWETPIFAANLFAAGHAAIGYYEAYKEFGDQRYLDKAIYWIRSIIPFTHLWESDQVKMLYKTKPVLSSSDWYFANWVRDHVQWEVLGVFAQSIGRGIQWGDIDPEIDWDRFHEGITNAAIRWMIVHEEDTWRPHNIPATYEAYLNGDYDYCYPDTHNSHTGNYGGMFIPSDPIAVNIYGILDRKKMKNQ